MEKKNEPTNQGSFNCLWVGTGQEQRDYWAAPLSEASAEFLEATWVHPASGDICLGLGEEERSHPADLPRWRAATVPIKGPTHLIPK